MLELADVHKSYRVGPVEIPIVKGVTLTLKEREIVSIMGSSGSGKTTLMNMIGLLDRPTSGQVLIDGLDVGTVAADGLADIRNRTVGFVFQQFFLLPRLSARENVELPLTYRAVPDAERRRRAMTALERVGMGKRSGHRPQALSGGERQRVAIARAIVGEPRLLLADEPTGALDTKTGAEVMELFRALNRENGMALVIVTHDPHVAAQCPRRVVMSDGLLVNDSGVFDHALEPSSASPASAGHA
ncbi:putative ABC transport system ATP-binding protein [Stella humosa]|uniref:Putative ABC transport system ATP-binding protein n=2 Tax=Stella humosa TaxID=94 RepID=A0A3N1MAT7_9PROT|nr:putative ABC transport system ATP-binding protein [Stella humosa]BBK30956.1 ABC transporter ATP-binding protein [Stella humosa]